MTINQHAHIYKFHTSNLCLKKYFFLNFYQCRPYHWDWMSRSSLGPLAWTHVANSLASVNCTKWPETVKRPWSNALHSLRLDEQIPKERFWRQSCGSGWTVVKKIHNSRRSREFTNSIFLRIRGVATSSRTQQTLSSKLNGQTPAIFFVCDKFTLNL